MDEKDEDTTMEYENLGETDCDVIGTAWDPEDVDEW